MFFSFTRFLALACLLFAFVHCVADTDEYRDADNGQGSYFDNHNMDPAVVDSAQFGILWEVPFLNKEQFYAKPLLFTPNGGTQLIFMASSMNYIRTLDAKTGNLINQRQVQTPFLQSDIGCTDIPNYIGIIGTPVIDPATEIAYFYAKTYIPDYRTPGNTGVINGVYYFYAVYVNDLTDVPGYPVLVDGSIADNDPRKYFIGGTILQRPSLLQVGNMIYAGFGGHCDLYNYTGTVLGFDLTQKAVTTNFAVESGPNSRFSLDWSVNGAGGQGGIWMAGMGLASDGNRLFFSTGNGASGENQGTPASGQSGCRTLGETVTNLGIDSGTGKLSLVDYFQPYDYVNMDGGDQDFGSGGVALLDPKTFNGTGVARMAVTTGKNGKIYFMNADNLGGYKQGAGQTDLVVQTIVTNEAVFGGIGSYPLEGGFIYSTPVGYPTSVYKLGQNAAGVPSFSYVGKTTESSAGRVGPGVPTITTYEGRPGTAIMWTTDPDAGLRAWYAVPNPDGTMTRIKLAQTGGSNKFQRPSFGDGKLYTTDANGVLYCLGAPVNLPLNCSSPVDFGPVTLGSSSKQTVNCTALIGITSINSITTGDLNFVVDTSTVPTGAIAQGTSFGIGVTWNLTGVSVTPAVNASYGNTTPGVKSTALTIGTTNAIGGYTTSFPLSLTGTEVSNAAFLSVTPQTVDFGGLVLGLEGENPSSSLTFTIANLGQNAMTILGYAYTADTGDDDDDDDTPALTNTTYSNTAQTWDLGPGFTTTYLPAIKSVLGAGQSASISALFNATNGTGNYLSYFNVYSSGGQAEIILEGSASTKPIANFSISNGEGGWLPSSDLLMDFGVAAPGQTVTRQIQICNEGGSVLTITKSKPPLGDIRAQNYGIDLHESQQVAVDTCAYGTVVFNPSPEAPNVPDYVETNQWTLNVDDTDFGVHVVNMTGVVHDLVVGPTNQNGSAVFNYLGCYLDNGLNGQGARLLPQQPYVDIQNNTNGECQTACQAKGYTFSGTEYQQECWCGNDLPSAQWFSQASDGKCTFSCPGDPNQACGGNGGYESIYYDSTKYTVNSQTYNSTATSPSGPVSGPQTVNASGPYNYLGCYSEGSNGRALTGQAVGAPAAGGSVEYCESQCAAGGFQYFGVEYSNECYCGNIINAGSVLQTGDSVAAGCNMVCGGNSSEYCGGGNRLNMFQLNGTLATTTSSSTVATPAATTSGTTITIVTAPSQTPLSCPASNSTIYTAPSGAQFIIECGLDHSGGDIGGVAAQSLEQCIASCDAKVGCVDVSLSGTACYMKSSVGAPVQDGVLGARLLQSASPASLSSVLTISSVLSSTSSGTTTNTSVTSGVSSTTTASSSLATISASTSSAFANVTSSGSVSSTLVLPSALTSLSSTASFYASSSTASSSTASSSTASSSTASSSAVIPTLSGSVNSTTAISTSVHTSSLFTSVSTSSLSASVSSVLSSSSLTSTTTISTLSSSSSAAPSQTPPTCPGSNSTIYQATTGSLWQIQCSIDHAGGDMASYQVTGANNFQGCIEKCANTTGCVDVSLSGVACYLKKSLGTASQNGGILGAQLVGSAASSPATTISSALPSSTTTAVLNAPVSSSSSTTSAPTSSTLVSSIPGSSAAGSATPSTLSSSTVSSSLSVSTTSSITSPITSSTPASSTSASSIPTSSSTSALSTSISGSIFRSSSVASTASSIVSSATSSASPPTTSSATSSSPTSTPTTSSSTAPVVPTAPPMIGNYTYQGCFNDSTSLRALTGGGFYGSLTNNMTLEKCATYCSKYSFFGVEYGQECYCGNNLLNNSMNQTASSCKTACPGNSTELCGAGNSLNLYYFNATLANTTSSSAPAATSTAPASHRKLRRSRFYDEFFAES